MSIEGMLCAAGLALLGAGVLIRARLASLPVPTTANGAGRPQGQVPVPLGERSPGWWAGTAALWLGAALLIAAGGVVFLRFTLFSVAS